MQIKKSKGFTLIEMLVVIVVIGILATVVLVSVSGARKQALATKLKTMMVETQKSFESAASSGCRVIGFEDDGQGNAALKCSTPDSDTAFITLSHLPPTTSSTITLQLSKGSATLTGSGDTPAWSTLGQTQGSSINGGYSFQVSGFVNGDTFTCADGIGSRSGCYCSTEGGCATVQ
ncbi:MAG: type II secretion system protein [Candidatus Moraniibacteriota bacterium]